MRWCSFLNDHWKRRKLSRSSAQITTMTALPRLLELVCSHDDQNTKLEPRRTKAMAKEAQEPLITQSAQIKSRRGVISYTQIQRLP
mmetsp:Transcript_22551/g.51892  ORF Transcript_22551/g.51892 Transcript_22551/m.51892 type:complete len:86 (+) Transcript_22551:493-750(+)